MLTVMLVVVAILFYFVSQRFNRIADEQEEANKRNALLAAAKVE